MKEERTEGILLLLPLLGTIEIGRLGMVVLGDIAPWTINVGTPSQVVGKRRSDVILAHALELGFPG